MASSESNRSDANGGPAASVARQQEQPQVEGQHVHHAAPPPLIYLGPLLAGLALQRLWPIRPLPRVLARPLGWLLVIGGLALAGWSTLTFRRAGTSVNPTRPTRQLVTSGPFQYTRNPIYVGLTAIYLGITALADALWPLLLLPSVLRVMRQGVIEHEEEYLGRLFGEEYERYQRDVRRWL